MKKFFKTLVAVVIAISLITPAMSHAAGSPVYSGKTAVYHDQILIGTTNLGGLAIFKFSGNKIQPLVSQHTFEFRYGDGKDYQDLAFSEEGGRMYVYATNGRTIFKYDFSDLKTLVLNKEFKNTTWDYITGIKRTNDRIVTVGTNGVKIYNFNLEVIDAYKIYNQNAYNIDLSNNGKNIYSMTEDGLVIYSTLKRQTVATTSIGNAKIENRKVMNVGNYIYAVDNNKLIKFDNNGKIIASRAIAKRGYDVAGIEGSQFAYFTNGLSVEKFKLADLKQVKAVKAAGLAKGTTNWAIGLNAVKTSKGERVIVFNNQSIVVMDANLNVLTAIKTGK